MTSHPEDDDSAALRDVPDEPPPFLGTWGRVYTAVLAFLIIVILSFLAFTQTFQR